MNGIGNNNDRDETPTNASSSNNRPIRRDSTNIHISVECPVEPRIAEITYDGREIIQPPISKGEKLYRNATKINFGKENNVDGVTDELISVGLEDSREKEARIRRGRPDPVTVVTSLESVRAKLKSAFTEMSVLQDVIALSRDRKYLRLEPSNNEPVERKPHFNQFCKRKAVLAASQVLADAIARLRTTASGATASQKADNDYHSSLVKLRDQWRLKKVGAHVSGDLSYRTVGSSLRNAGQFEIRKNEDPDQKPIEVIIAGDLSGESRIQIDIESNVFPDSKKNYERELRTTDPWSRILTIDSPLHRQLTAAQNSLYCRELMMLLSAEAVNLPNQCLSPVVFGDEIHYTSFLGHSVHVKLVQVPVNSADDGLTDAKEVTLSSIFNPNSTLAESRTIEWAISLTMLSRMRDLVNPDLPIAACGPMGLKSYRRKMAIQARDRRVWKQPTAGRTLTSQILDMAQCMLLRKRLLKIADEVCSPDVVLVVHDCSSLTSWKDALVKISLTTPGYDIYNRASCAFHIYHGEASFVTRDFSMPISISDDLDVHLLYLEIVRHHAIVLQNAVKAHRFEVTQYVPSYDFFSSTDRPVSSSLTKALAYGITLIARSHDDRWWIKIVCSLRYVYRLYVASGRSGKVQSSAVRNDTFLPAAIHFHEIDLNGVVAGDTRIRRISTVLGFLATLPEDSTFLVDSEAPETKLHRDTPGWTKWKTDTTKGILVD